MSAAQRISRFLKDYCQAAQVVSADRGEPISKEGWRGREAEKIGVSESAYEAWFFGDNPPNAENLFNLVERYGADLLNAFLEPLGLRVVKAAGEDREARDDADLLECMRRDIEELQRRDRRRAGRP